MDIIDSIEKIHKLFEKNNSNTIRYSDIDIIPNHHEALKEMKECGLVYIRFDGNKVFIDKIYEI